MANGLKVKHSWIFVLLIALFFGGSVVSAATPNAGVPLFPVKAGAEQYDYEKYDTWNYAWDPSGIMNKYDPLYMVGNFLMVIAAFIVRGAIFLLSIGLHPEMLEDIFVVIVQVISHSPKVILTRFWPFVAVGTVLLLIWDYQKGDYTKMMKRWISIGLVLVIMGLYYALSAPGLKLASDGIDAMATTFSGAVVSLAAPLSGEEGADDNSDQFLKTETSIYDMVWKITVEQPWQMGQFGSIDEPIDEHVDEVKDALSEDDHAIDVTAETKWKDVFLRYPRNSDVRTELVDVYEEVEPDRFRTAFAGEYRLIIGFCTFLASLVIFVFFALMGVLLIALFLVFLAMIIAGVVIIPFSLIPIYENQGALRWLAKILSFSAIGKVAIGVYVGVVFLVVMIFSKTKFSALFVDGNANGFLVTLFFNVFWYIAGIAFFIYLLHKLKAKAGWGSNRGRKKRIDGDYVDDYEDEDDDEDGISRSRKRRKYTRKSRKISSDFVDDHTHNDGNSRSRGASSDVVDMPDGKENNNSSKKRKKNAAAGPNQSDNKGASDTSGSSDNLDSDLSKTKNHPDAIPIPDKIQAPKINLNVPPAGGPGKEKIRIKEGEDQSAQQQLPSDMLEIHRANSRENEVAATTDTPKMDKTGPRDIPIPSATRSHKETVALKQPDTDVTRGKQEVDKQGIGRELTKQPERTEQIQVQKETSDGQTNPGKIHEDVVPVDSGKVGHDDVVHDSGKMGHEGSETKELVIGGRGDQQQPIPANGEGVAAKLQAETASVRPIPIPPVQKNKASTPVQSEQGNHGKIHEDTINMGTQQMSEERSEVKKKKPEIGRQQSQPVKEEQTATQVNKSTKPGEGKPKDTLSKPPLLKREKPSEQHDGEHRKSAKIHYD
jgi:hypothetical protein